MLDSLFDKVVKFIKKRPQHKCFLVNLGKFCKNAFFFADHLRTACSFIKKETLAQVFSCEFCEISKNTFSYRTPLVAASEFGGDL